ncbi:circularly permutated Ras 1-like [Brachionus plicatilis]|uniref:Circularly permutated Ras 1-like n=1 Tax=Brachionus plicatilis TaxID=10195 RepID=A0A3M7QG18_BRAPC|nr:circularly permutated Ras 1-like [Brachionus plicatilis]
MDFCSKYAYDYGFDGSDEEDADMDSIKFNLKKIRKADTNIISFCFDKLIDTNQMFAGEPIKCKKCEAILTSRKSISSDQKIWKCEYCYENNEINISSLDQVPDQDQVTFLIEPAPQESSSSSTQSEASDDNKYLIYCIDISGSMNTYVTADGSSRSSPIMTRLAAVQVACIENLGMLKSLEPKKRVALSTFSDKVKFYSDGCSSNELVLGGSSPSVFGRMGFNFNSQTSHQSQDILSNKDELLAKANNESGDLKAVKDSHSILEKRIKALRTDGMTALGPALTFCIGFASRLAGSQIILCTDGCANVGIGSLQGNDPSSEVFYEELAKFAKSKGVVVNVITIEGTDCKLALLGKVADLTNGSINIVNPLNLNEEFKSILENRSIATEVNTKLIVNGKYLYIRDNNYEAAEAQAYESGDAEAKKELEKTRKSVLDKNIGNVNMGSEITYEFGIRRLNEEEKKDSNGLNKLPFQLQVSYTMPNGAKALKVFVKEQEFTRDREQAEKDILSKELFFANFAQKASSHVTKSNVKAARYKQHQLQQFNSRTNYEMPEMNQQMNVVFDMNPEAKSSAMTDLQSRDFNRAKKANRNFFK